MNNFKFDVKNTVFISDLDGTLLNKDAALSSFTAEELTRLIQKSGLRFTIATARTIESVKHIMKGIPLFIPMILMNGVLLYDPLTGKYTQVFPIPREDFVFCAGKIRESGAGAFGYTIENKSSLMTHYEDLKTPYMREFFEERRNKYRKPFNKVESLESIAASADSSSEPIYLALLDVKEKLDPVYEAVKKSPSLATAYYSDIYSESLWYLEIFSAKATKKNAACELKRQTGIPVAVGIGDNLNDLPLFEACDISAAVANAKPEVIGKADIVIGSNTDDGVVRFLSQAIT